MGFATCLDQDESDHERTQLTIHLRNDDMYRYTHYLWGQPPCAMYEKIILDEGYTRVLIVTSGKPPCAAWFQKFGKKHNVEIKVQTGSILQDFCALARARRLVLSFSTFP